MGKPGGTYLTFCPFSQQENIHLSEETSVIGHTEHHSGDVHPFLYTSVVLPREGLRFKLTYPPIMGNHRRHLGGRSND